MEPHKQGEDALALLLYAEVHFSAGLCWYQLVSAGLHREKGTKNFRIVFGLTLSTCSDPC